MTIFDKQLFNSVKNFSKIKFLKQFLYFFILFTSHLLYFKSKNIEKWSDISDTLKPLEMFLFVMLISVFVAQD